MRQISFYIGASSLFLIGVICLASCGPGAVYEREQVFPGYWTYADSVVFQYEILDTSKAYDLKLSLKHTDAFAKQNLYARFVTHYPSEAVESEQVSLELSDKYGRWLGDCAGEACELKLTLQAGARFPEPGQYGLTLHQFGRSDTLAGIVSMSFHVQESTQ